MDEHLMTELKLLEIKLSEKIEKQNLLLSQILEQVKRTNGRVTKLEEWRHTHELNTAEDLMEYRFMKKYPRYTIIMVALLVILTILSILKN